MVITDLLTNDLQTTGLFTTTGGTTSSSVLFNRARYKIGRRRGALVEVAKDITRQVDNLVVTQRLVFYPVDSATKKNVHVRYNL